ncbi:MAG: hypothetical protein H8E44_24710 [Planctomycetes bacterium]|nr:hypothetical protein [Planctomycetota bacterium]MBL7040182.1 hypothetical protein [Pirellulaceae bacterium]
MILKTPAIRTTSTSGQRILREPFPLEPFETYMLMDNQPGYPTLTRMIFEFDGVADRGLLDETLAEALAYEPLLTSTVEQRGRRHFWVPSPTLPKLHWESSPEGTPGVLAERTRILKSCIDLTKRPGLRALAHQDGERLTLTVNLHHSCGDAIGAVLLVEHWLSLYAARLEGREPRCLIRPDPDQVVVRGKRHIKTPRRTKLEAATSVSRDAVQWLLERPLALAPSYDPTCPNLDRPPWAVVTLDEDISRRLIVTAKAAGVGINSLLLRDFFLAMRDWNLEHDAPERNKRIRMVQPINIRTEEDLHLPVCNKLGYAFFGRRPAEMDDPQRLLDGIHEQMGEVIKWGKSVLFFEGLRIMSKWPAALRWLMGPRFCYSTAAFSNLGPIARYFRQPQFQETGNLVAGGLRLRRVVNVSPVRPNTSMVLAATACEGRITLCLEVDPRVHRHDDADRVLDAYVARLREGL